MPIQWRRRKGVSFQHITPWLPLGKGGSVHGAKKIDQDIFNTSNIRGTHQTVHLGHVLLIQLEPVPNICRLWQMGLGCNGKCLRDHGMSESRIWECMNEQERCSKMLKGILKDGTHQWWLESEQDFVCPWKQCKLCIRWPWVISLVSSIRCSIDYTTITTTLVWHCTITDLCHARDACAWSSTTHRPMPWWYLKEKKRVVEYVVTERIKKNIPRCPSHRTFWRG